MVRRLSEPSSKYAIAAKCLARLCALLTYVGCLVGCGQNANFINPFSAQPNGGLAQAPTGSPAQQVAQLEQWRRQAADEAEKLRGQVAQLTEQSKTLEAHVNNARQHAKLQDEHLASVSQRLKDTTAELANTQGQGVNASQNAASLNSLNEEKERQIAAARQSIQRLEGELHRSQMELQTVKSTLTQTEADKAESQRSVENLLAANRHRGGTTISANSNLPMPNINATGVTVQRDGDVIRVRLAADQVFQPGTVQIRADSSNALRNVAAELARTYPNQRIGVEGHANGATRLGGPWRNEHHFSSAQAMAVYELLISQSLFSANQLHIVGHGANHPVYSTATAAGRRANQRVELVIYSEKVVP